MSVLETYFHRATLWQRLRMAWNLVLGRPVSYGFPQGQKINVHGRRWIEGITL